MADQSAPDELTVEERLAALERRVAELERDRAEVQQIWRESLQRHDAD